MLWFAIVLWNRYNVPLSILKWRFVLMNNPVRFGFRSVVVVVLVAMLLSAGVLASESNRGGSKHAPKNIIVFIADGCGFYHVDAASLYQYGKTQSQLCEKFPVRLAMSTYLAGGSYDPNKAWASRGHVKGGTDSAAAATAMSCGVKSYKGAIGVDTDKKPVRNIIESCEKLGKATGVITSVQLSHATPAGFVAHDKSRNNYEAIAKEMINDSAVDVIMGCGHPLYDNSGKLALLPNTHKYVGGKSTWNALEAGTAGADADGDGVNDPWTLIQTRSEFAAMAEGDTPKRVCGVAQVHKTLQQERTGSGGAAPYAVELTDTVPTLAEMTRAALNVLDNDEDGFFLMVEGGAVDWASHDNQAGRMIEEQIDFNKSVEAVVAWVTKNSNWGETLVIVTGDHETGYLTGPKSVASAEELGWAPLVNNGKGNEPGMKWHSKGHTNSLIPFYAKGRGAQLFTKVADGEDPVRGAYIDNTAIAQVIFTLLD
jgi:alkaline phosphatase